MLAELGVTDVAVCGLAKRLEEVWLPAEPDPVILSRTSEGLYLLQRVRDEAHRFAITYHRQRRSAGMTVSELDAVPGPRARSAGRAAQALRVGAQAQGGQRRRDRRGARLRAVARPAAVVDRARRGARRMTIRIPSEERPPASTSP